MRSIVMGVGAVGGVIGGRLHGAGLPVVLVARGTDVGRYPTGVDAWPRGSPATFRRPRSARSPTRT